MDSEKLDKTEAPKKDFMLTLVKEFQDSRDRILSKYKSDFSSKGKVNIGGRITFDPTPKTMYASKVVKFPDIDLPEDLLDPKKVFKEVKTVQFDPVEAKVTKFIRSKECEDLKYWYNVTSWKHRYFKPHSDGYALLLPEDRDKTKWPQDWLTYNSQDGVYFDVMNEIVEELYKTPHPKEDEELFNQLLVNYSYWFPYGPSIRRDGSYKNEEFLNIPIVKYYIQKIEELFLFNLETFHDSDEMRSSMNSSKSNGNVNRYPDGTVFNKKDCYMVPEHFAQCAPSNIQRYSTKPLKKAWEMPAVDNLRRLMVWYKRFHIKGEKWDREDLTGFKDLIVHYAMPIAMIASRYNDPDKISGEGKCTADDDRYPKNRLGCVEVEPCIFAEGEIDSEAFNKRYKSYMNAKADNKSKHYKIRGKSLRRRTIYATMTPSIACTMINCFRFMMKPIEDSGFGFPTNSPLVEKRVNYFGRFKSVCWTGFDTVNSEQYMTDNYNHVCSYFKTGLGEFLKMSAMTLIPDTFGLRFTTGIASGSPPTSCDNFLFNAPTIAVYIQELYRALGKNITLDGLKGIVNQIFDIIRRIEMDRILSNPLEEYELPLPGLPITLLLFANLDDIAIGNGSNEVTEEFLVKICDQAMQSVLKIHSKLKGEVSTELRAWGNIFTHELTVNQSSVLTRFPLTEHTENGDQAAFAYSARHEAIQRQYYEAIQRVYKRLGLGTLEAYRKAADNYLFLLSTFGFSTNQLYNKYSPKNKIVFGPAFKKAGIDVEENDDRYSKKFADSVYSLLWNFINDPEIIVKGEKDGKDVISHAKEE